MVGSAGAPNTLQIVVLRAGNSRLLSIQLKPAILAPCLVVLALVCADVVESPLQDGVDYLLPLSSVLLQLMSRSTLLLFLHIKTLPLQVSRYVVFPDPGTLSCQILNFIEVGSALGSPNFPFPLFLRPPFSPEVVAGARSSLPVFDINYVIQVGFSMWWMRLMGPPLLGWKAVRVVPTDPWDVLSLKIEVVEVVPSLEGFGLAFRYLHSGAYVAMGRLNLEAFPAVVALGQIEHLSNRQRRFGVANALLRRLSPNHLCH